MRRLLKSCSVYRSRLRMHTLFWRFLLPWMENFTTAERVLAHSCNNDASLITRSQLLAARRNFARSRWQMPVVFVARFEPLSNDNDRVAGDEIHNKIARTGTAEKSRWPGMVGIREGARSYDVGQCVRSRGFSAHLHHDATHGLVVRGHVEVNAWQCHVLSCCGEAS